MELPTEAQHLEHGVIHWDQPLIRQGRNNLLHVLATCGDCQTSRYVQVNECLRPTRKRSGLCGPCRRRRHYQTLNCERGPKSSRYKGPRRLNQNGYWMVGLYPGDEFYDTMGTGTRQDEGYVRYVLEHRLVMAIHLGRPLAPWEHIHHRDGDKLNNTRSNLELIDGTTHATVTALMAEHARLALENTRLKTELLALQQFLTQQPSRQGLSDQ